MGAQRYRALSCVQGASARLEVDKFNFSKYHSGWGCFPGYFSGLIHNIMVSTVFFNSVAIVFLSVCWSDFSALAQLSWMDAGDGLV